MTDLDRLPPDQRAVLSLVLDRGKSYAEVGELLAMPEAYVRERAHAALDALAHDPAVGGSNPQSAPPAPVDTSRPSRAGTARTGATEVGPASGSVVAGGTGARGRAAGAPSTSGPGASPTSGASSSPLSPQRGPHATRTPASSRRAGALLLSAIAVVIVVAVILIASSGGKGSGTTATTTGTISTSTSNPSNSTSSTSTSGSSASKPKLDKTIELSSPEPALKASGTAYVLSEGKKRAFYVAAEGLPPSSGFFYAVWLYNSPSSSEPLGRASNVTSNGRLQGGNPLPSSASDYAKLIVTRETSTHPSHPGPIVLSGAFTS